MTDQTVTAANTDPTVPSTLDRAYGALAGLALGDALGMPTQSLPRSDVQARYGRITGFVDGAPDQPIAPEMTGGSVTDDTEQAILVANLLLDGDGHIEPRGFASALIDWEQSMIRRGSRDLLGPSTKSALMALQSGADPGEAGRYGTTNGAAMRIAPVGIATAVGPLLLQRILQASSVTHNTGLGISAAAAIAVAVSAGIQGASTKAALRAGLSAADSCRDEGSWVAGASIHDRYQAMVPIARRLDEVEFADFLYNVVGTSVQSQESVVSALLLVERYHHDPFQGLCTAASLGGDTDTIAAIAGSILGACHGASALPSAELQILEKINNLGLEPLAEGLLVLRSHSGV
ncbi:ADP-ribosylglycohydrolase family protein [Arthrobacter castelli]|uniref:ADP-ribosylglycohydrolase family protein n=1 Tax=Arthrobacter castelli TaxID=271431 RepID=UPI0003F4CBDA|nr:ADP-ribosylglycohydrolase family protein [Arthrobacter castelli]